MGTVVEKIEYIAGTKDAIKKAIEGKGVSVDDADTFRSYADKIAEIGGGSDMFAAELTLENVVKSGAPTTEEEVTAELLPVLKNIVGE